MALFKVRDFLLNTELKRRTVQSNQIKSCQMGGWNISLEIHERETVSMNKIGHCDWHYMYV